MADPVNYRDYCHDCGLAYGSEGWADFVVNDAVWKRIAPAEGEGLLCVTCIIRRCYRLGLENLSGRFTSGPFATYSEIDG